jgi:hypothetical protein
MDLILRLVLRLACRFGRLKEDVFRHRARCVHPFVSALPRQRLPSQYTINLLYATHFKAVVVANVYILNRLRTRYINVYYSIIFSNQRSAGRCPMCLSAADVLGEFYRK